MEALLKLKGCKNVIQIKDIFYTFRDEEEIDPNPETPQHTSTRTDKLDKTVQAKCKTSDILAHKDLKKCTIYENIVME